MSDFKVYALTAVVVIVLFAAVAYFFGESIKQFYIDEAIENRASSLATDLADKDYLVILVNPYEDGKNATVVLEPITQNPNKIVWLMFETCTAEQAAVKEGDEIRITHSSRRLGKTDNLKAKQSCYLKFQVLPKNNKGERLYVRLFFLYKLIDADDLVFFFTCRSFNNNFIAVLLVKQRSTHT